MEEQVNWFVNYAFKSPPAKEAKCIDSVETIDFLNVNERLLIIQAFIEDENIENSQVLEEKGILVMERWLDAYPYENSLFVGCILIVKDSINSSHSRKLVNDLLVGVTRIKKELLVWNEMVLMICKGTTIENYGCFVFTNEVTRNQAEMAAREIDDWLSLHTKNGLLQATLVPIIINRHLENVEFKLDMSHVDLISMHKIFSSE